MRMRHTRKGSEDTPRVERFEAAYEGTPPWDIGVPQPAFVDLEKRTPFGTTVLDVGCGTGALALYLASRGYTVTGVDIVEKAVARAASRAKESGATVEFLHGNALKLPALLRREFDTVVDSGVFHTFPPALRPDYRDSLAGVLRPGGMYYMLVWSDRESREGGPLRIRREEILDTFSSGWKVLSIAPARFAGHGLGKGAHAWLSAIRNENDR
jgi:SAM-dependent methyltransferase